jgi:hypothetical protein
MFDSQNVFTKTIKTKKDFIKKTRTDLNKRVKRLINFRKIKRVLSLDSNSDDVVTRSFKRESRTKSIAKIMIEI